MTMRFCEFAMKRTMMSIHRPLFRPVGLKLTARAFIWCVALTGMSKTVIAQSYIIYDCEFSTSGQSMWGPGDTPGNAGQVHEIFTVE